MAIHFPILLLYDLLVFLLERQGVAILSLDSREGRVAIHVLINLSITPLFLLEGLGVAIQSLGCRETRGGQPLSPYFLICFLRERQGFGHPLLRSSRGKGVAILSRILSCSSIIISFLIVERHSPSFEGGRWWSSFAFF